MLTLAMPQSEPRAERNSSASRRSLVKIDEERPCGDGVVQGDRLAEIAISHHIEDRREGLAQHEAGLRRHLDERRAHIEPPRARRPRRARRRSRRRRRPSPLRARLPSPRTRLASISGPTRVPARERIADRDRGDRRASSRRSARREPPRATISRRRRGAALARRAHRGEGDGAHGQIEIGATGRRSPRCCRQAPGAPGRSAPASRGPTARPIAVEPVAETQRDVAIDRPGSRRSRARRSARSRDARARSRLRR